MSEQSTVPPYSQPRPPVPFHFASLGARLFAAFAGVLILSLVLTAISFWLQIRLYNSQQVRQDLLAVAPSVRAEVKAALVRYWEKPSGSLDDLKGQLVRVAHSAGVRVLLTDYCNNVAIDTASTNPLRALGRAAATPASCSPLLDDLGGADGSHPTRLTVVVSLDRVRQATLPHTGTIFYLAFLPPPFFSYAPVQPGNTPLLVRTIIVAKEQGGVDQEALRNILPQLAVAGVLAVLVTLLVVLAIVRAITRPLHTITVASERMARGDYDQRVPEAGEDEVGQLARSFNRMALEVRNAREHQRQFIANVSHDLKTPLTSILGFSRILSENEGVASDAMGRRAVQVIDEEARRLQRLTVDLLDLSRLEAGQLRLRRELVDLNALAGGVLARFADLPANATRTFQDGRCQGALPVWGDPDRLTQVLVNLVDNAVKFSDSGGSVGVLTVGLGAEVALTVANTGAGIAPEDLSRVFGRFYRTDHSRAARTGGTGLGLAIVREIVAAHGGQVTARSDPDGWTRFIVTLPRASEPPPMPAAPDA